MTTDRFTFWGKVFFWLVVAPQSNEVRLYEVKFVNKCMNSFVWSKTTVIIPLNLDQQLIVFGVIFREIIRIIMFEIIANLHQQKIFIFPLISLLWAFTFDDRLHGCRR